MVNSALDNEVYQIVREAARTGKSVTVSEVARQTGAACSSVYRVASHYGYDSWVDFTNGLRHYFQEGSLGDTTSQSVRAVADALLRNRHKSILIDAVGDAEIAASYLQYRLAELGFISMVFTKSIVEAWGGDTRSGLCIVINESGTSLLQTCLEAAERGYETLGITSSHDTPVSKVCNINVVIKNNKSTIGAYEPNYFTAGTLAFVERVLRRIVMD